MFLLSAMLFSSVERFSVLGLTDVNTLGATFLLMQMGWPFVVNELNTQIGRLAAFFGPGEGLIGFGLIFHRFFRFKVAKAPVMYFFEWFSNGSRLLHDTVAVGATVLLMQMWWPCVVNDLNIRIRRLAACFGPGEGSEGFSLILVSLFSYIFKQENCILAYLFFFAVPGNSDGQVAYPSLVEHDSRNPQGCVSSMI